MASNILSHGLRRRAIIPLIIAAAIVIFLVFTGLSSTPLRAVGRSSIPGVSKVSAKLGDYEFPWTKPNIDWASASPESLGMDGSKLKALKALIENLSEINTEAFLVVKSDRIVSEWYRNGLSANKTFSISALAKAGQCGAHGSSQRWPNQPG